MKKLQPGDEVVKIDEDLGIAWILLPLMNHWEDFGVSPLGLWMRRNSRLQRRSQREGKVKAG